MFKNMRKRLFSTAVLLLIAFISAAVADVLYGLYGFAEMLPVTWPEDAETLPVSNHPDNVLFPYGSGVVTW